MPSEEPIRGGHPGRTWPPIGETPSVSPVDGSVVGWFRTARPEEVSAAASRVRHAAPEWAATPLRERLQALRRLREALASHADCLAELLGAEIGRPVSEAYGAELLPTLRCLAWLERNAGRVLAPEVLARLPARRELAWEPHGVIGLLSPWNYPVYLSLPTIAAALVAGNTVLWKPSDLALAVSCRLGEVLRDAGLERFVAVTPGGPEVGQAVVRAGCDKYVLIGGASTGEAVLSELGRQLRPAVAELSGCDPLLVLRDADVETAAKAAVWARLVGAGQTCMAPRRIFVQQAVYPRFLEAAALLVRRLRVGDPASPTTEVGPVRTEALLERAHAAIDEAMGLGAALLAGGRERPGNGFYLEPALLADCDEGMSVFRDDLFAPVMAVSAVGSAEEAVSRIHAIPHVLTASVWTRNRRHGAAVAACLPGSVVMVNDALLPAADPGTPFGGGGGRSGYGRVRGAAGLREMVRTRVTDLGPPAWLPRMHFFPYQEGTREILRATLRLENSGSAGRMAALNELRRAVRRYRDNENRGQQR